jgi:hypothetical protein
VIWSTTGRPPSSEVRTETREFFLTSAVVIVLPSGPSTWTLSLILNCSVFPVPGSIVIDDPGVYSVTVPVVRGVVLVDIVDVDGVVSPDEGLKLVAGAVVVVEVCA